MKRYTRSSPHHKATIKLAVLIRYTQHLQSLTGLAEKTNSFFLRPKKTKHVYDSNNVLSVLYQNSDSRDSHQIEWTIKITAQNNIKRRYNEKHSKQKRRHGWKLEKFQIGLQLWVLMNFYPDSFSKFIFWLFVTFDILLGRYVCWNTLKSHDTPLKITCP